MKPTFHHRPVNDLFGDPCVFVRMLRERGAFLFDAGDLSRLDAGDLHKVTDLFVTHTHIDHFIGFDQLLRALLRRDIPLRVYGPENIISCVEGKLGGYTWNVIEQYPLVVEVIAIGDHDVRHAEFRAGNRFRRVDLGTSRYSGFVLKDGPYAVAAVQLSHGTPCLGFALEEDFHININKAALNTLGLPVGPWLADLKRMVRQKAEPGTSLVIGGRELRFSEVGHVAEITKGQKVSYVTDVSPEGSNIGKIIELVKDSDTLYCEAYFLDKDRGRAEERNHLTARMAGSIARKAGVRNLIIIHSSQKYRSVPGEIEKEAMDEFRQPERVK
jgi:ribonuclease Z